MNYTYSFGLPEIVIERGISRFKDTIVCSIQAFDNSKNLLGQVTWNSGNFGANSDLKPDNKLTFSVAQATDFSVVWSISNLGADDAVDRFNSLLEAGVDTITNAIGSALGIPTSMISAFNEVLKPLVDEVGNRISPNCDQVMMAEVEFFQNAGPSSVPITNVVSVGPNAQTKSLCDNKWKYQARWVLTYLEPIDLGGQPSTTIPSSSTPSTSIDTASFTSSVAPATVTIISNVGQGTMATAANLVTASSVLSQVSSSSVAQILVPSSSFSGAQSSENHNAALGLSIPFNITFGLFALHLLILKSFKLL